MTTSPLVCLVARCILIPLPRIPAGWLFLKPASHLSTLWLLRPALSLTASEVLQVSPGPANASSSHNARESTVVRIPLRSAKHHFGVTRARGNRPYNEDHYQAGVIGIPPFAPSAAGHVEQTPSDQYDSVFYFGVFDGHGGEDCSKFLKENLHTYIEETSKRFNGESEDDGAVEARKSLQMNLIRAWKETVGGYFRRFKPDFGRPVGCGAAGDGSVEAALAYAFLRADLDFITKTPPWFAEGSDTVIKMEPKPDTPSTHFEGGSTASVVLVSTPYVLVATVPSIS